MSTPKPLDRIGQRFPLFMAAAMALVALTALGGRTRAQGHPHPAERVPASAPARVASHAALHMVMTPRVPATAADSARAAGVARALRAALAPYADTAAAVRAGYVMFAPQLKQQRVYHFTSGWRAVQEGFRFDPARPTSLLYTKGSDGTFTLVGAMYTAPKRFTAEQLDARIPLGIARWHRHVNWCVPKRGASERWLERRDGMPVFGPESPIATADECNAVRGTFHANVFGWMVHANVLAGDDPGSIWGDEHAGHDMHDGLQAESPRIPRR